MHGGAYILAVSFGPTAHPPERRDDRPSQPGQRILKGPGPRSGRAPVDQPRGFQIAQSSGKHALGNVSNVAAQFPVPVRPFFQREEDLRRPSADYDRARLFDACGLFVVARTASLSSRYNLVPGAHEINLAWNVEMPGVTSVAGFQSRQCVSDRLGLADITAAVRAPGAGGGERRQESRAPRLENPRQTVKTAVTRSQRGLSGASAVIWTS